MTYKRVMIILCLVTALLIAGGGIPTLLSGNNYKGTEYFQSEHEYTEFKKELAKVQPEIIEMSVLASNPPIIVNFELITDSFSYGEIDRGKYTGVAIAFTLAVIFLVIAGVIPFKYRDETEKGDE